MEVACTLRARLRGLSGRDGFDGELLLVPCNDVHTFTMARPLDIAFVARDGVVLEAHRLAMPGRRFRNRRAVMTIERFSTDDDWYRPGDRLRLSAIAS